jgi:hypothetical protein
MVKTVRKIWEIVKRFKRRCQSKGWQVIEREDIIKRNGEFHNILWTRNIQPSTFKSIAVKETSTIQEDTSYRPIDVAYNAWICATPLSDSLKQTIAKKPKLLKRNAVYDLSQICAKGAAGKLNKTGSEVLQEFESFLKDELQSELNPIQMQVHKGVL